jgi:hypothetical protein
VQKSVDGESTAAPFDGVVVRWRLLAAPSGDYRIRVLGPAGGSTYSALHSSAVETVVDSSPFKRITTFQTRLPIPADGYVGLVPPRFTIQRPATRARGSTYVQVNDLSDGDSVDFGGYAGGTAEFLYDADVEPDADADGFGDVSQDACPTDRSTQAACPAFAGPPPPEAKPKQLCRGKIATRVGSTGKDRLRGSKTRRRDRCARRQRHDRRPRRQRSGLRRARRRHDQGRTRK